VDLFLGFLFSSIGLCILFFRSALYMILNLSGLTYFLTLWWCNCGTYSVETVLQSLNFNLFQLVAQSDTLCGPGQRDGRPHVPASCVTVRGSLTAPAPPRAALCCAAWLGRHLAQIFDFRCF
jgi:hypothetical protein